MEEVKRNHVETLKVMLEKHRAEGKALEEEIEARLNSIKQFFSFVNEMTR
jgi:hypothetical protein